MINKNKIIQICEEYLPRFEKSIKNLKFEPKGIFNSEMLLFTALTKKLGVKLIIESGRARGQSTKIIAENFKDPQNQIISVESLKYHPDARVAYKRLNHYTNLQLKFGNSFKLLPKLINGECCILIDGPKTGSLDLTIELLKNSLVKAVFIHDLHKDSKERKRAENLLNNHFFSDDMDYLHRFQNIDKQCWIDQRKSRRYRNWGPYHRDGKKMKSYSSTLLFVQNNNESVDITYYSNESHYAKKSKKSKTLKDRLKIFEDRLKFLIKFPFYYLFYEKKYNPNNSINLKDLVFNMVNIIILIIKSLYY